MRMKNEDFMLQKKEKILLQWQKVNNFMEDKIDYWNTYYTIKNPSEKVPSQFAVFVLNELSNKKIFFDIGCGDARDSLLFSQYNKEVIGIDGSETVITKNNLASSKNLKFKKLNFSNKEEITNFCKMNKVFDPVIYARFFLHALNEQEENNFLYFCNSLIKTKGHVCLEYRTKNDANRNKETDDHFRRFINPEMLKNKMLDMDYKLIYHIEGIGLAKHKTDDAYVARDIFIK